MANPGVPRTAGPVSSRVNQSRPGAAFQLDALSKAIIEKLQQDGRRSYAGIGKSVGLSEAAVRQRVQRMVDAGVMQIVAVTDPMQLGFARQAMIGIRCTGDTTKIRALPGVLSTETLVYLKLVKQQYNWGTR